MKIMSILAALAIVCLSSGSLHAQAPKPAKESASEVRQEAVENEPVQLESQRETEDADSAVVIKETKGPTVWDTTAGKQFMNAIQTRKDRWKDFDQIVFKSKVAYSEDMVALMAQSPYAADIAYYLGLHPHESEQYAAMTRIQVEPAIRSIEEKAKADGVKQVVEPVRP